jgi:hypothetical protein
MPLRAFRAFGVLKNFFYCYQSSDRKLAMIRQMPVKDNRSNEVISNQNSMGLFSLVTRLNSHDPQFRNTSPVAKPSQAK